MIDLAQDPGELYEEQEAFIRGEDLEDLEDLLIETLQSVSGERNEDTRRAYRLILMTAICDSDRSYDEVLRFIRLLEERQPTHLEVPRAYDAEPPPSTDVIADSRRNTVGERLPDTVSDQVDDLVHQLGDLRLTTDLGGMVTGPTAVDLRPLITPLGRPFLGYVLAAEG